MVPATIARDAVVRSRLRAAVSTALDSVWVIAGMGSLLVGVVPLLFAYSQSMRHHAGPGGRPGPRMLPKPAPSGGNDDCRTHGDGRWPWHSGQRGPSRRERDSGAPICCPLRRARARERFACRRKGANLGEMTRTGPATGPCSRSPLPTPPGANGRARYHRALKRQVQPHSHSRSNMRGSVIPVNERTMHR